MEPNGLALDRLRPPPLVLLVVDEQDRRQRYAEALLHARHSVAETGDAHQALEKAVTLAPDIVVADLHSPAFDGVDFYQRLRADERTHDVLVIVMTSHAPHDAVLFDEHVLFIAPCAPERLLTEVDTVLSRAHTRIDEPPLLLAGGSSADELILARIRGEYLEMPGLRLTQPQARRLWGLDLSTCERVLRLLVDANFLSMRPDGTYARATDGDQLPVPQRRMLKATIASSPGPQLRRREHS